MGKASRLVRRLWPSGLAGQLIALLLLALLLSQVVSVLILMDERRIAIRTAERKQILERTASIVQLIESAPSTLHDQIVRTASTGHLQFWLSEQSAAQPRHDGSGDNHLQRRFESMIDDGLVREVIVDLRDDDGLWRHPRDDDDADVAWDGRAVDRDGDLDLDHSEIVPARAGEARLGDDHDESWRAPRRGHHGPSSLLVSARLANGAWLNAGMGVPPPSPRWALPSLLSMAVMAVSLSLIVIVMVRRITRPMAALATAAESLGRGETVPRLAERGPLDVRQTTRAFNQMNDRLQRFVRDRTRMLAAISHDLRTPITSLRLRAEFIEDEETRAKILETLNEMQRMIEATLAFAREEAAREDTRSVDLGALIESLCDDLAEMGLDVTFATGQPEAGDPQSGRECRRLRRPRPRRARAGRRWSGDHDRRRRPRDPRARLRARVRAVRAPRGVAQPGYRGDRARDGDRPLDRARPRRRHLAREPGRRRPARDPPLAPGRS
jgi:His Kinase A (phospho-acceptor) domain/HAMP domain